MSGFALRLPDDLKQEAARQAESLGVSLNQFLVSAVASRVGAQAEARRYFAARATRVQPGTAKEILARVGQGVPPRDDDHIE
jgi:hypothetical protein